MTIDAQGYRSNVGIVLINQDNRVFWARRLGQQAWQFPQGGLSADETPKEAMHRELWEEVGLLPDDVDVLGETKEWLRYAIPDHLLRRRSSPVCLGQKQKWFLLKLKVPEEKIQLNASEHPEFDSWSWMPYWHPVHHIIYFKKEVYQNVLQEFYTQVFGT